MSFNSLTINLPNKALVELPIIALVVLLLTVPTKSIADHQGEANFFYSHAQRMSEDEPFTHTGTLALTVEPISPNPWSNSAPEGLVALDAYADLIISCINNARFSAQISGHMLQITNPALLKQLFPSAEIAFVIAALPGIYPWILSYTQIDSCAGTKISITNEPLAVVIGIPSINEQGALADVIIIPLSPALTAQKDLESFFSADSILIF